MESQITRERLNFRQVSVLKNVFVWYTPFTVTMNVLYLRQDFVMNGFCFMGFTEFLYPNFKAAVLFFFLLSPYPTFCDSGLSTLIVSDLNLNLKLT